MSSKSKYYKILKKKHPKNKIGEFDSSFSDNGQIMMGELRLSVYYGEIERKYGLICNQWKFCLAFHFFIYILLSNGFFCLFVSF